MPQKAVITHFIQDNSELQILYFCFVFEEFISEKIASKFHAVIFSPPNTNREAFQLVNAKIWSQLLESVLLEHITVLLTLIGPFVLALTGTSRSFSMFKPLNPKYHYFQIKYESLPQPVKDLGVAF